MQLSPSFLSPSRAPPRPDEIHQRDLQRIISQVLDRFFQVGPQAKIREVPEFARTKLKYDLR